MCVTRPGGSVLSEHDSEEAPSTHAVSEDKYFERGTAKMMCRSMSNAVQIAPMLNGCMGIQYYRVECTPPAPAKK